MQKKKSKSSWINTCVITAAVCCCLGIGDGLISTGLRSRGRTAPQPASNISLAKRIQQAKPAVYIQLVPAADSKKQVAE
jgi:hypothetical protein